VPFTVTAIACATLSPLRKAPCLPGLHCLPRLPGLPASHRTSFWDLL